MTADASTAAAQKQQRRRRGSRGAGLTFELGPPAGLSGGLGRGRGGGAGSEAPKGARVRSACFASVAAAQSGARGAPPAQGPSPPQQSKVALKPASDILAGALARAASQSTIHPLDTLKVRLQAGECGTRLPRTLSKFGQLVTPTGAAQSVKAALPGVASLYRGVLGAASGAGLYIGAYFAFYGAACNALTRRTDMPPGAIAFAAGGIAAAGGSLVKVPLAVCIRSVQAGVYPHAFAAAAAITRAAGVRGLYTGYLPTLLEDVPDMALKFAAYESLRSAHRRLHPHRPATAQEDFVMGAISGAFAAAATTPLDVVKTCMMTNAAARPSMATAARAIHARGSLPGFFSGAGARAVSSGLNSAVFFCFFEALRARLAQQGAAAQVKRVVREVLAPVAPPRPHAAAAAARPSPAAARLHATHLHSHAPDPVAMLAIQPCEGA